MANEPDRMVDQGVGRVIRILREDRGLTQGDLAKRLLALGWSLGSTGVAKVESGRRALRVAELYLMARALDVRPFDLLGDDDQEVSRTLGRLTGHVANARQSLAAVVGHAGRVMRLRKDPNGREILRAAGLNPDRIEEQVGAIVAEAARNAEGIRLWEPDPESAAAALAVGQRLVDIATKDVVTVDSEPLPPYEPLSDLDGQHQEAP